MLIKILKYFLFYLKGILFFPHMLLFFISNNRELLKLDAINTIKPLDLSYKCNGALAVLWLLENDRYFRTMFYSRIGILSNLVSWYTPGEHTFMPCCPSVGGAFIWLILMQPF